MRRVALTLLVLATGAPSAAAAAPRAVDFEQTARFAPASATAGAARAWHATAPRAAPLRFDLLGVRGGREVEVRVRRGDGRWTRWVRAHAHEPVWTGPADAYQLRVAGRAPRALRVHFVAVDGRPAAPPPARAAAAGRPPIVPRSAWDPANQCPPRVQPIYGRVDFAMVHHTVSLNGYGPRDVPAIVLAICRFHRNANEWNDIGYNLLVDRSGVVYEGRGGGAREPVVGAQAQGWNSVSTGIAAIGDFSGGGLPAGALRALAEAIAWKLSLAGVPATGTVGEVSIGGDVNRHPEGARVRFQRISGHRDGDLTSCPGPGLAAQLPALRAQVARLLPAPRDLLTISPVQDAPQPAGATGGSVLLTGRLARADGRRPGDEPIALQARDGDAWIDVATARTGADGIWSAALPLEADARLRALHAPSGIASPTVAASVRAGVRLRVARRAARPGGAIELSGTTIPAKGRVRIVLERRRGDDRRRLRRVRTVVVATLEGRFALTLRAPGPGAYRVTARTPADRVNAAGRSRALGVRVLGRR